MSGFEFLTLGEVFLGVTFYQKTFLLYKIFLVSKQNFEKMAPFHLKTSLNGLQSLSFPRDYRERLERKTRERERD